MASVFARSSARALPALSALDGGDLDEAIAAFVPCELGPGEVLVDPDDGEHPALMLLAGEVSLHTADVPSLHLGRLGPGAVLGGSPLHGGTRPSLRVLTERTCHVLVLETEGAQWLQARSHPALDRLTAAALESAVAALRGAAERLVQLARLPDDPQSAAPPSLLGRIAERLGLPRGAPPRPEPLLAGSRVFAGVDAVSSGWLADHLDAIPLAKHQLIQLERCATTGLWLLAEGSIALERDIAPGQPELLEILRPGALLGLPGLIDGGPAPVSARAAERSWAYHLGDTAAAALLSAPEATPLRRAILASLDERIRQVGVGLSELALQARRGSITDRRMLRATAAALWAVPRAETARGSLTAPPGGH